MIVTLSLGVALVAVGQGPIDAFHANFASIKARVDFKADYFYQVNAHFLDLLHEDSPGPGPAGKPGYIVEGRWDYDESVEHFVMRLAGGTMWNPGDRSGPLSSAEVLCNQELLASHELGRPESSLHVWFPVNESPHILISPFIWHTFLRFDREIEIKCASISPRRTLFLRGKYPTQGEVYECQDGDVMVRMEVYYDPEVGHLPRFYRKIAYEVSSAKMEAGVVEFYLIEARPCPSGGFVPTEWFLAQYDVADFKEKYPKYTEETRIGLSSSPLTIIHFQATDFSALPGEAKLEEMAGVRQVLAPGGVISRKADLGTLTMSQLKDLLGSRLQPSNRPKLPKIDVAEQHEFDPKPSSWHWLPYLFGVIGVVAMLAMIRTWRRRRYLVGLLLFVVAPSCESRPVTRLGAAFAHPVVVYDPAATSLRMPLNVTNVGNCPITIFKVDAGCSCRQVDPAQLPTTIPPGDVVRIAIGMNGAKTFAPQTLTFTFSTDRGSLVAPATIFTLPKHHLSPDFVTISNLAEDGKVGEGTFELVHREVFTGDKHEEAGLVLPANLSSERLATSGGRVANAPGLNSRDVRYRLTIQDRSLGLHRVDVGLQGVDGGKILSIPVVWQRLPFLSSVPERVVLSARTSRVFLRCPEESVDIARVVSAPPGVKAIQDSPRSIAVSITDQTPGIVDGVIEIETTAKDRAPLRVPVVRYAPPTPK